MMKEVCYIFPEENQNEIAAKSLACPASFLVVRDRGLEWDEERERFKHFEWTIWANERDLPEIEMVFAPYV